jgi:hypothetical protein
MAPAAICRKVALTPDGGEIEVWGDRKQTRFFMYVDDCVEGIYRIMGSGYPRPLNLGTDELVNIDQLVDSVSEITGKRIIKRHDPSKPQGVRGRNSDNSRLRQVLGWEPEISLRQGLTSTYAWIESELEKTGRVPGLTLSEASSGFHVAESGDLQRSASHGTLHQDDRPTRATDVNTVSHLTRTHHHQDNLGKQANVICRDRRRLSKDYECLPETGEAMLGGAISRIMLRRLLAGDAKHLHLRGAPDPCLQNSL